MKLRNIIMSLLAVTVLAAGCNRDQIDPSFDSFSTSTGFVNLPTDGSEVTLEVNSTESWSIYERLFPEDKDWTKFKVEPLSGEPGKTTVKISSSATTSNRQMELCFIIGERATVDALGAELDVIVDEYDRLKKLALDKEDEDAVKKVWDKKKKAAEQLLSSALVKVKRQYVTVKQSAGEAKVKFSTCAEIATGPNKTYYAKGSVTNIENTLYGNWTLKDATGTMYIYGTLDEAGQDKNFESLGLAEGDFVEIMGPRSVFNNKPQLKNITVLKIEKGIIKLDKVESTVKKDVKSVDIALTVLDETDWSVSKIYSLDSDKNKVEIDWATVGTSSLKSGKIYQTINVEDYLENATPRVAYIIFSATRTEEVESKDAKSPATEGGLPYVVTSKGETIYLEGKIEVGTELFTLDGEVRVPVADGKIELDDKATLKVENGKVTEIVETKVAELTYTLTQVGNVPELKTVNEAVAEAANSWVRIKGVVTGLSKYGVVVANTKGGAIFCDDITTVAVGDSVHVSGYVSGYRKFFQLTDCYCEKIPADTKAEYPTPVVLTSEVVAAIADRNEDATLQYIKFTGRAVADGTKGDIMFEIGDYRLKPYNVHSNIYVEKAIGKDVAVYGYAYQLKENDLRFVITDLKWAEDDVTE